MRRFANPREVDNEKLVIAVMGAALLAHRSHSLKESLVVGMGSADAGARSAHCVDDAGQGSA
jgi:hypothetical protein